MVTSRYEMLLQSRSRAMKKSGLLRIQCALTSAAVSGRMRARVRKRNETGNARTGARRILGILDKEVTMIWMYLGLKKERL